jgi:hypothetical protein
LTVQVLGFNAVYMSEEHHLLFSHTREAAQRFEYFLLGISVALCAYIGQTVKPEKLGFSAYTLEIASLAVLIASVVAGFKRVEAMIATSSLNHDVVDLQFRRAKLVKRETMFDERTGAPLNDFQMDYAISEMTKVLHKRQSALDKAVAQGRRWYWWRKLLLAVGFGGLFAAKILGPYIADIAATLGIR